MIFYKFAVMKPRAQRIDAIRETLMAKRVANQTELVAILREKGYTASQGAVSRDLKALGAVKRTDRSGQTFYEIDGHRESSEGVLSSDSDLPTGVLSIAICGNMCVVKTRNGHASALAYNIDMQGNASVIGTIAGADTIFAVIDPGTSIDEITPIILQASKEEFPL